MHLSLQQNIRISYKIFRSQWNPSGLNKNQGILIKSLQFKTNLCESFVTPTKSKNINEIIADPLQINENQTNLCGSVVNQWTSMAIIEICADLMYF